MPEPDCYGETTVSFVPVDPYHGRAGRDGPRQLAGYLDREVKFSAFEPSGSSRPIFSSRKTPNGLRMVFIDRVFADAAR